MIIDDYKVTPYSEQETIITYDAERKAWYIYTDVPPHARKWESMIDRSKPFKKGYNVNGGALVMLEGCLKECNVTISKKRKLTEEQKKALAERLNGNK
ncbi:hypothetical protein [Enterococcus cecorum]|uniref:hypothetical protein n=1 Tax=Enterococcus cecorum TaxID=44008 RepID=UPI002ACA252B|nr:hypothetical protein [Enterococcus cecorum]MDZ5548237.1 hypothetical protein [Enterococcus cecorum]MDZ5594157.1 hypothetical protein [Enterococcus cecorum]